MQNSERKFKDWQNPQFMFWICQIYPKVNTHKIIIWPSRKLRYTSMAIQTTLAQEKKHAWRVWNTQGPTNAGVQLPLHAFAGRRRNTNADPNHSSQ